MSRPVASWVAHTPVESSGVVLKVHRVLAGLGVIGLDEAADAVFATIRADQDLAVDGCWRHGFGIAEFGIGDLLFPNQLAGLGIECHEFRIERTHVDHVAIDGDTAIVGPAAVGR